MKKINTISAIAATLMALASVSAQAMQTPTNLLGTVSTPDLATRSINIDNGTKYVNVAYGETVRFNTNGQEFVVEFNGTPSSFALNQLAPSGVLNHTVEVYVTPSQNDERQL